jgi:hypothetical protein
MLTPYDHSLSRNVPQQREFRVKYNYTELVNLHYAEHLAA